MKEDKAKAVLVSYIIGHEPVTLNCAEELKEKLEEMSMPQLMALFRERDLIEYCIEWDRCVGDGDIVRLL